MALRNPMCVACIFQPKATLTQMFIVMKGRRIITLCLLLVTLLSLANSLRVLAPGDRTSLFDLFGNGSGTDFSAITHHLMGLFLP